MTWETVYNFLGIRDFIYFISSSQIQDMLFPVKLVFVSCGAIFLVFVIYFMLNSSWLQYKFLEDVSEFFSWQAYGQRALTRQLGKIKKRIETGAEADYKLAIIDADDFLMEVLDSGGYEGKDLVEMLTRAGRLVAPVLKDVLKAHEIRDAIVYNPDYKLSADQAKKALETYENAIKSIGMA
jgi:hypothetical protein